MKCYHPIRAFQGKPGTPLFFSPQKNTTQIEVPCGQCIGCRLSQAQQWAIRCVHEAKLWPKNTFGTFTYDDEHLPPDLNLDKPAFQKYLKRQREHEKRKKDNTIRYMMCGEYGEQYSRPHYHAILFNFQPHDLKYYKTTKAGHAIYTSEYVDKIWGHGKTYWGEANYETAGYIARYVTKTFTTESHQEILDVTTGEIIKRVRPYSERSQHPGLGAKWIAKYGATDVYPHDRVIHDGTPLPVPRYYHKLHERQAPLYHAENRSKRVAKSAAKNELLYEQHIAQGLNPYADYHRLVTEETVKKAQIKSLRRE